MKRSIVDGFRTKDEVQVFLTGDTHELETGKAYSEVRITLVEDLDPTSVTTSAFQLALTVVEATQLRATLDRFLSVLSHHEKQFLAEYRETQIPLAPF